MKNIYYHELVTLFLLVLALMSGCSKVENPIETPKVDTVKVPITMITIPSGTFTMGCTNEQIYCDSTEVPIHQVTLSTYEIAKYEITQFQWRRVMGTSPSYTTGDNNPVEQVSWYDAINFCNALSTGEGLTPVYTINGTTIIVNWSSNGYRLPTEAEWEYAARGGAATTNTIYSGSNSLQDVAWYYNNSITKTHHVGTKSPNQLGIYDMSGNVEEWCWDWHLEDYYYYSPLSNPKGPDSGSRRMYRGGCYIFSERSCQVATRSEIGPGAKMFYVGFRVARTKN